MIRALRMFPLLLPLLALSPASQAAEISVGGTGWTLEAPEGYRAQEAGDDPEVLLTLEGPGHSIRVLRSAPGATGQAMTESFETRMHRSYRDFRLAAQERVRIGETGAQYRRYEGRDEDHPVFVHAVVFVWRRTRLVLYASGRTDPPEEVRKILLSLRAGEGVDDSPPPEETDPEAGPEPPPDAPEKGEDPGRRTPVRWIELRGTGYRIAPPQGWTGGPHGATRGTRIVSEDRGCILDVTALKPDAKDPRVGLADRAADDFEKQLLANGAGWTRVESRRVTIGDRAARLRRYEGRPGGLPCHFLVGVFPAGRFILVAKAIYPAHLAERYREKVMKSLQSVKRN